MKERFEGPARPKPVIGYSDDGSCTTRATTLLRAWPSSLGDHTDRRFASTRVCGLPYSLHDSRASPAFKFPKLFLRLSPKSQTSDFPMTLAKWFFEKLPIDSKRLAFYHRH
jgi:hypothetical protein